jgi:hypothetical protein
VSSALWRNHAATVHTVHVYRCTSSACTLDCIKYHDSAARSRCARCMLARIRCCTSYCQQSCTARVLHNRAWQGLYCQDPYMLCRKHALQTKCSKCCTHLPGLYGLQCPFALPCLSWKREVTDAVRLHCRRIIIIIINPCKPYHFGIGTAPHPLGRWRVDCKRISDHHDLLQLRLGRSIPSTACIPVRQVHNKNKHMASGQTCTRLKKAGLISIAHTPHFKRY